MEAGDAPTMRPDLTYKAPNTTETPKGDLGLPNRDGI